MNSSLLPLAPRPPQVPRDLADGGARARLQRVPRHRPPGDPAGADAGRLLQDLEGPVERHPGGGDAAGSRR